MKLSSNGKAYPLFMLSLLQEQEFMLILLQAASTRFPVQAEWATPYLYDAVYLYMVLVSKMIADGLDYRNGALMFRKSYEYNINFTGEERNIVIIIIIIEE